MRAVCGFGYDEARYWAEILATVNAVASLHGGNSFDAQAIAITFRASVTINLVNEHATMLLIPAIGRVAHSKDARSEASTLWAATRPRFLLEAALTRILRSVPGIAAYFLVTRLHIVVLVRAGLG